MAGFWGGFSQGLESQIEKGLDERRKRSSPGGKLQADIYRALQAAQQRPAQADMQAQADALERSATPGVPLDLQRALAGTRAGQSYDQADRGQQFVDSIRRMGIGSVSNEGISLHSQQPDFATQIAQILAINERSNQQAPPAQPPFQPQQSAPVQQQGTGIEALPGLNRLTGLSRAVQRGIGARETQRGLMDSYATKTAPIAKALDDSGNIAVQEREMILRSLPSDSETLEHRNAIYNSSMDFFDKKEAALQQAANAQVQQIVSGTSGRSGVRTQLDPAAIALKKKAQEGLLKIRQARTMYQQLFSEANQQMPAIGAAQGGGQSAGSQYVRTGTDKATGRKVGMKADGTVEFLN